MAISAEFRAGYVTLVGRPNVGKSTLLNQLLKFKLSIVTRKPQTTRKRILGILSEKNYQIIFTDTPGLIEPHYNLQDIMMTYLKSAVKDADVLVYMADAAKPQRDFTEVDQQVLTIEKPVILALNKVDLLPRDQLLPLIAHYQKQFKFTEIVPVSALKNDGVEILLKEIVARLPLSPPYFPLDQVTDQQERFFVAEIIREKIFNFYGEEIPYSCHVQIEAFKQRKGKKDYISAIIYVDQASQKGILIGKKGLALKRVGEAARIDIEEFLERPVFLELYVKVLEGWRKNPMKLESLGY
jgi:GTP-binding protein Era